MAIENVTSVTAANPAVATETATQAVTTDTYAQMLNVLDELLTHTHIFYDDYGTNCNCNCNCQCGRGLL